MALILDGTEGVSSTGGTQVIDGMTLDAAAPATTIVTTSAGNVGIGTASPTQTLDVSGNIYSTGSLRMTGGGSAATPSIQPGNDADSGLFLPLANNVGVSTAGVERMRIDSSGKLLIGVTSFTSGGGGTQLGTSGNNEFSSTSTGAVQQLGFHNPNGEVGSIYTTGSSTVFATASDYRLKENATSITGATDRLKRLNPVRFNFIVDADTTVDGFIAHEAQEVVPEAVIGDQDAVDSDGNPKYQGIDQSKLVPLLVAALQEQQAAIESLTARVILLETV